MARRDGFDPSTAHFTDASSFDDDFSYDLEIGDTPEVPDFLDNEDDLDDEVDDEAFGFDSDEMTMDERLAAARRDRDRGSVTVPVGLDTFASDITEIDLRKLGFRPETNPFGNDETPRKEQFKLISNAMTCCACGTGFQTKDEMKPGYLPAEKYEIQEKLSKIEEVQRLQEKADSGDWSTDDEIEWLIQGRGSSDKTAMGVDIQSMADQLGIDLLEISAKKVICKRCHGLQNFGEVPEMLRPGWSEEPLLSQESFRNLLLPLRQKKAVIIALVDLFDFCGSVLPELDSIAGDNPVLLAANKADLLPAKMGQHRAENWVRRELEYLGVRSIANVGGAVRLVSCKTGFGVNELLGKARAMAEDMDCDIFVVGAANAGKSTLINHILEKNERESASPRFKEKRKAGNANKWKGYVTTSPLPGTTLKFIKVDLGNGKSLYDTPGLLVAGTLTQRLTPAELKMIVPKK